MKVEEFEKRQAAMSDKELIELAHKEVSELAKTGGRSHRMCVPPMITDTDMILSEVIKRFEHLSNSNNKPFVIPAVSVSLPDSFRNFIRTHHLSAKWEQWLKDTEGNER